jgi:hypothetical protein
MSFPTMPEMVFWLAFGGALGGAYFYLLRLSVAGISDTFTWLPTIGYLATRIVLAGGAFAFAAMHGAGPLLLGLCGFLIMRHIVVRRYREG